MEGDHRLQATDTGNVDGKHDAITQMCIFKVSHHSVSASYSDRPIALCENRPLSYCASVMIQEQTIASSGSVSSQFFIRCLGEKITGNL